VTTADPHPAWPEIAADLRRYVQRRVHDEHAAEDIVQDVFLKLAQQLHTAPPAGPLHAWVFAVAHHAIIDHYRRGKAVAMPAEELADELPTSTVNGDAEPLFASFRSFLHSLPAEQREAILLTEYEGLTQRELAERLGVAVSTVKSRVQRGRKRLERALHDCCTFEFDRRGHLVDWQRKPGGSGCGDDCGDRC
jgi:RNA polymerase sigma-70 factor, ECF subfamily